MPCASDGADVGHVGIPDLDVVVGEGELNRALPSNVVLFIGDGMGAEQQRATRMFKNGDAAPLTFEAFPHAGCVHTANASGGVTDSAAAATAMATGHKVDNHVISQRTPGDGRELPTVVEIAHARGKSTGLVTTATPLTDATPAAFGAHASTRYDDASIANGYLQRSRPAVLMGGPSASMTAGAAADAGYATASSSDELDAIGAAAAAPLCGIFDGAEPSLAERTRAALEELLADEDGFFLLVEHEGTDNGGHANDLAMIIDAVLALEAAVDTALALTDAADTLIIVTADHETGSLTVHDASPEAGAVPEHSFGTTGHSGADVPIFATGPGAEAVGGCFQNTRIFSLLTATR